MSIKWFCLFLRAGLAHAKQGNGNDKLLQTMAARRRFSGRCGMHAFVIIAVLTASMHVQRYELW